MRALRRGLIPLLLAGLLLPACRQTRPPGPETEAYREPEGRFSILRPAGWSLATASRAGVSHWRFTPEPLPDPDADSDRELAVAIIPLPEDVDLTAASLEEVAEYVRDATIETAAEAGERWRAGPPRSGTVGGRPFSRFELAGDDAAGTRHLLAILVVRDEDAAVVVSFGCPEAEAATVLPRLERCAASLRIPAE